MMGVDGDANEEWLVNMGSFGTKVGWCLSGGRSEGNSQRGGFDDEWSCRWWIWCEFGECEDWELVGMRGEHACIVHVCLGWLRRSLLESEWWSR